MLSSNRSRRLHIISCRSNRNNPLSMALAVVGGSKLHAAFNTRILRMNRAARHKPSALAWSTSDCWAFLAVGISARSYCHNTKILVCLMDFWHANVSHAPHENYLETHIYAYIMFYLFPQANTSLSRHWRRAILLLVMKSNRCWAKREYSRWRIPCDIRFWSICLHVSRQRFVRFFWYTLCNLIRVCRVESNKIVASFPLDSNTFAL